jgi:hypothetical protein
MLVLVVSPVLLILQQFMELHLEPAEVEEQFVMERLLEVREEIQMLETVLEVRVQLRHSLKVALLILVAEEEEALLTLVLVVAFVMLAAMVDLELLFCIFN